MKAWKFTEPYQAEIVDVEQPVVSEGNDKESMLSHSYSMSYSVGALLEPYCVGLHAVRQAKIKLNQTIGIIEAGTSQYCLQR